MSSILIAGATGSVGREVLRLVKDRGHSATVLSRSASSLRAEANRVIAFDATQGIPDLSGHDAVISALGAPITMGHRDRRCYRDVDYAGNRNLLLGAKRAGVKRFIYVSAHVEPAYAGTEYVRAHEEFCEELRLSGLARTVVRPTGIFSAFHDFLPMARRGLMTVLGDGKARTNPIHQADVAALCVDALSHERSGEIEAGGPDVFTRREIAELVFEAVGRKPRIIRVPAGLFYGMGTMVRLVQPRVGELLRFVSRVTTVDCIAKPAGALHLRDYFRELAGRAG